MCLYRSSRFTVGIMARWPTLFGREISSKTAGPCFPVSLVCVQYDFFLDTDTSRPLHAVQTQCRTNVCTISW